MSEITAAPPEGTPTWIDLGIPDLDRAMAFYGGLFGWEFEVGPEEVGRYTMCLLRGRPVAALMPNPDPDATRFWWNMYFATDDLDRTVARVVEAGGTVVAEPMDVMEQGRMAVAVDPVGGQFGLWQAGAFFGYQIANEPNSVIRNDLVTASPGPAREFYAKVFDYTVKDNPDLPGMDFTFLHRPDGHEIGGIMGSSDAKKSMWDTLFEVSDADETAARAAAAGATVGDAQDTPYARMVTMTDPFGAEFSVGSRPVHN